MTTTTTKNPANVEKTTVKSFFKNWHIIEIKNRGAMGCSIHIAHNSGSDCFRVSYTRQLRDQNNHMIKKSKFDPSKGHKVCEYIGYGEPDKNVNYDEKLTPQRATTVSLLVTRWDGTTRIKKGDKDSRDITISDNPARRMLDKRFGNGAADYLIDLLFSGGLAEAA